MISVSEALRRVLSHRLPISSETVSLRRAVGRVLAEPLLADRDFPPFDRVTMDGIALAFPDGWPAPVAGNGLLIEATQFAGEPPQRLGHRAHAIEVMTGAVLPEGTQAVVRYEDVALETRDGRRYATLLLSPQPGQNIHRRGEDRRAGDLLVPVGTRLSPAEIAVAASVGKADLLVQRTPRVAVVSTGDELVAVDETPLPHQIRRSNGAMLVAALAGRGVEAEEFHLTDDRAALTHHLVGLLETFDVLLLSGGVSAGKKDFVPEVLAELGVEKQFHQVAQRPGKPFWFGAKPGGPVVFALPGNPVSTFLCFLKYVVPFLPVAPTPGSARAVLTESVTFTPDLTYFVPVSTHRDPETGQRLARPLKGSGSGDFANLLDCDGFLELPTGRNEYPAGEAFGYLGFR
jgi:molybdopterin molybdotransferase